MWYLHFSILFRYPGDTGRGGGWSDKENYVALLDELRSEFDKHEWLLSAAVPAPKSRIDPGTSYIFTVFS